MYRLVTHMRERLSMYHSCEACYMCVSFLLPRSKRRQLLTVVSSLAWGERPLCSRSTSRRERHASEPPSQPSDESRRNAMKPRDMKARDGRQLSAAPTDEPHTLCCHFHLMSFVPSSTIPCPFIATRLSLCLPHLSTL